MVEDHVRQSIAGVMGMASGDHIGERQRLFEIGIDSLMAVELGNVIQNSLAISLPSTLIFDYPTLESLIGHLATELGIDETDTASHSPAGVSGAADDLEESTEEDIAMLLEQELSAQGADDGRGDTA